MFCVKLSLYKYIHKLAVKTYLAHFSWTVEIHGKSCKLASQEFITWYSISTPVLILGSDGLHTWKTVKRVASIIFWSSQLYACCVHDTSYKAQVPIWIKMYLRSFPFPLQCHFTSFLRSNDYLLDLLWTHHSIMLSCHVPYLSYTRHLDAINMEYAQLWKHSSRNVLHSLCTLAPRMASC